MTTEASTLLRVKQTQIKMIRDRGFDVSSELPLLDYQFDNPDDLNQFISFYSTIAKEKKVLFREALRSVYYNSDDSAVAVYYPVSTGSDRVGVNQIATILTEVKDIAGLITLVVVIEDTLTSDARKKLAGIKSANEAEEAKKSYFVQLFTDDQLITSPIEHRWVPKHVPLTDAETEEFLTRSNLRPGQLATLRFVDLASLELANDKNSVHPIDPVVAYYGWRPGQIVRIHRHNFLTDSMVEATVFYRRVSY